MQIDDQQFFLTTAGSKTLCGAYVSGVSDYRDTGAAGALDGHRKKYLNIEGLVDLTSTDADTLTIKLVSHDDVLFSGPTTEYTTGAIAKDAIADAIYHIALPEDMLRYIRIEWTVTSVGTVSAGGSFNAFLSDS